MRLVCTMLNFFFPGAGYLLAGQKRLLALMWLVGVIGLTYVELSLKEPLPQLYWTMFASVFVMNTAFAIDVFKSFPARDAAPGRAPVPA